MKANHTKRRVTVTGRRAEPAQSRQKPSVFMTVPFRWDLGGLQASPDGDNWLPVVSMSVYDDKIVMDDTHGTTISMPLRGARCRIRVALGDDTTAVFAKNA